MNDAAIEVRAQLLRIETQEGGVLRKEVSGRSLEENEHSRSRQRQCEEFEQRAAIADERMDQTFIGNRRCRDGCAHVRREASPASTQRARTSDRDAPPTPASCDAAPRDRDDARDGRDAPSPPTTELF